MATVRGYDCKAGTIAEGLANQPSPTPAATAMSAAPPS